MRSAPLSLFFALSAVSGLGCSEPECTMFEYKVADQCFPKGKDAGTDTDSSTSPAAGATDSRDAAADSSATARDASSIPLDAFAPVVDASAGASSSEDATTLVPDEAATMAASPACVPAEERCDALDNDCDGEIDEGVKSRCWADEDGDGFAAMGAAVTEVCGECGAKRTKVEPTDRTKTDCNDGDATRSPTVTDVCGDKVDNDCDGTADDDANNVCGGPCTTQLPGRPGEACTNGLRGACARSGTYQCQADHSLRCSAGAATGTTERCDAIDNDCDGEVDEGVKNACGGCATLPNAPDSACSAGAGACLAGGSYKCDGPDKVVCNATPAAAPTWYPDCDGDGYGVLTGSMQSCTPPAPPTGCAGYVRQTPVTGSTLDCHDDSTNYHPRADFGGPTIFPGGGTDADNDLNCDGVEEALRTELQILGADGLPEARVRFCRDPMIDPALPGECEEDDCIRFIAPDTWQSVSCAPPSNLVAVTWYDVRSVGTPPATVCARVRKYAMTLCR